MSTRGSGWDPSGLSADTATSRSSIADGLMSTDIELGGLYSYRCYDY
ncbi:MAG: hypothetical protein M4D80_16500 [Myxococcota bacterium]|nr:hypothetical protein [Myxococcota bacterium]